MAAGATAVVIYNNVASNDPGGQGGPVSGTLCRSSDSAGNCIDADDLVFNYVLAIGISKEDGEAIAGTNHGTTTVSARPDDYAILSGTSMSTPHVTGVAALIWSLAPTATAQQVKDALLTTATDLGAAGYDTVFGNGQVDALAAAKKLAPQLFSSQPPPKIRSRRSGH